MPPARIVAEDEQIPEPTKIAKTHEVINETLAKFTNNDTRRELKAQFTATTPTPIPSLFIYALTLVVGVNPAEPTSDFMTNVHAAMVIFLAYGWNYHDHIKRMILDHARNVGFSAATIMYFSIVKTKKLIFRRQNYFSSSTDRPLVVSNEPMDDRIKYRAVLPLAAILAQVGFWLWSIPDGPAKLNELLQEQQPIQNLLELLFLLIRSSEAEWYIKEKITFPARTSTNITEFLNDPRTVRHLVCFITCVCYLLQISKRRFCFCVVLIHVQPHSCRTLAPHCLLPCPPPPGPSNGLQPVPRRLSQLQDPHPARR
jgi:hypothetical protein